MLESSLEGGLCTSVLYEIQWKEGTACPFGGQPFCDSNYGEESTNQAFCCLHEPGVS